MIFISSGITTRVKNGKRKTGEDRTRNFIGEEFFFSYLYLQDGRLREIVRAYRFVSFKTINGQIKLTSALNVATSVNRRRRRRK